METSYICTSPQTALMIGYNACKKIQIELLRNLTNNSQIYVEKPRSKSKQGTPEEKYQDLLQSWSNEDSVCWHRYRQTAHWNRLENPETVTERGDRGGCLRYDGESTADH